MDSSDKPKKSHKAMPDREWHKRLRTFASTGTWKTECGNRPRPKQMKWYEAYKKVLVKYKYHPRINRTLSEKKFVR